MHSLSGFLASYVMNAVWQVAAIFLAVWLASFALRRLGPQVEQPVWVLSLLAAVVTPALPLIRHIPGLLIGSHAAAGGAAVVLFAGQGAAPQRAGVIALPQNWLLSLLVLYLASIAFFAGRLLFSLRGAARMLRQASPATLAPEQEEIWRRCRLAFSLSDARILVSTEVPGPVAVGLLRPALLLPVNFADRCAPADFLAAVAHECAHLKRRDFQKNLCYETASLILAFHPLTWVIKARIAQTREMICDAVAVEGYVDSRTYARSLLRLATIVASRPQASSIHAIGIFDGGILEKRIMQINLNKRPVHAILKYGLSVPALLFLLSVVIGTAAFAVAVEPAPASHQSSQASPYGPVYRVGPGVSAPIPLNRVEAKYPKSALKDKKAEGVVVLRMIVDTDGMARDIHVVRSYRPDFDANAVKAVKEYRFKPAMREGKPVAVSIKMEVNFKRY